MKSVLKIKRNGKVKDVISSANLQGGQTLDVQMDLRIEMIRQLVPLGLERVNEMLQEEVTAMVGARYVRTGGQTAGRFGVCG